MTSIKVLRTVMMSAAMALMLTFAMPTTQAEARGGDGYNFGGGYSHHYGRGYRHYPRYRNRYYAPRRYYYRYYVPRPRARRLYRQSNRHAYWSRRCAANWGYRNSNYYGCMRYHGYR